jgi:RNase P subunit RPR2
MKAWQLGGRSLIAASCRRCGKLFSGKSFHRHWRNGRDKAPYIDRRCPDCKWGSRVKGNRNAEIPALS